MLKNKQTVYQGKIIHITEEIWNLPNGHTATFEVVNHPGGVAIIAVNQQQHICLIRQFRPVIGDWLWEIPAGKREVNEDILITAQRELLEEAGAKAKHWQSLGQIWSSPGIFKEQISLFLAQDLTLENNQLEEGEVIEVHWFDIHHIHTLINNNTIQDGKTLIALFKFFQLIG